MLSHRARRSDRIAQLAVILSLKTFVRLHSAANKKFKQNPFFFSLRHRWSQLLGMLQESFKVTPPQFCFWEGAYSIWRWKEAGDESKCEKHLI